MDHMMVKVDTIIALASTMHVAVLDHQELHLMGKKLFNNLLIRK